MEDSWANIHLERDASGLVGSGLAPAPAGSGLDLHVELGGPRVRASLEAALRQAVQSGRLAAGARLPPSRTLATDLGVARNTVADVYGQLVAEGWLTARQGSGTRVAEHPAAEPPAVTGAAEKPNPADAARYSLKPGLPDLGEFPRTAWLAAARKAVTAAPRRAFGYGDPRGQPELRAALAAYLARARGVRAAPDQIVICSGFTQGLSLLGRVLAGSGAATAGVEAYGHRQHREVIEAAGLSPLPVPVDTHGAVIGQVPDCAALVLTPAHQFPLGVALAPERRQQAVAWAARTGAVVIEDDYDGEFRYDRRAVGAMQALAPEHVIYAGTASKTLAPAIRLGWLAVPRRMLADVIAAKECTDRHGSSLDELTLAEFINSGGYDRHVRRSRLRYQQRRSRLIAALAGVLPDPRVAGLAAGMHAVLHLPAGAGEDEVVAAAAARGLVLDGMRGYCTPGATYPDALVIGYGTPPAHAFTTAVTRLCTVLRVAQATS
jgi:GntR family transcriptional regulator / MocR family aminotransferase